MLVINTKVGEPITIHSRAGVSATLTVSGVSGWIAAAELAHDHPPCEPVRYAITREASHVWIDSDPLSVVLLPPDKAKSEIRLGFDDPDWQFRIEARGYDASNRKRWLEGGARGQEKAPSIH